MSSGSAELRMEREGAPRVALWTGWRRQEEGRMKNRKEGGK